MDFEIPEPLRVEHEELHAKLAEATQAGGLVGETARRVARILHSHFIREEEVALRPLGLLRSLAGGAVTAEMAGVLPMTHALKEELPRMLAEHQQILVALQALREAARRENHPEYERFAEQLVLHARMEEDVLYPAAVILGEYLELMLKRSSPQGT